MIARTWIGRAAHKNADAYVSFLESKVLKAIRDIEGHHGAYVLRRPNNENDDVEFLVITFWESMEAIRRFAGEDPSSAVIEPEARALLSKYDDRVKHYDVVCLPE